MGAATSSGRSACGAPSQRPPDSSAARAGPSRRGLGCGLGCAVRERAQLSTYPRCAGGTMPRGVLGRRAAEARHPLSRRRLTYSGTARLALSARSERLAVPYRYPLP
jgi:hypothetical protein